jgi:hypothetical protein
MAMPSAVTDGIAVLLKYEVDEDRRSMYGPLRYGGLSIPEM